MRLELVLILILILGNGFFSAAEIAVVTARKSKIQQLAANGDARAKLLATFQAAPESFLATVQMGVTVLGAASAALGGALAIGSVKPLIDRVHFLSAYSEFLSVALVVMTLSYASLIFAELIPKTLALKHPEKIALAVAYPFDALIHAFRPLVMGLTASIQLFVKPIGGKTFSSSFVSEEEIIQLLKEGREKGVFDTEEHAMITSAVAFNDISVKEVMVPRHKIHAFQIDTVAQDVLQEISQNMFSRYPVYRTNINDIVGVVYFKDFLQAFMNNQSIVLKNMLHSAYCVPETMRVSRLLHELRRRRIQMAIVINEYGSVEGLVTMEDLVEEIVGEIRDEYDTEERPVEKLRDGSLVVDASLSLRDLKNHDLPIPESADYETLGGFILSQLQDMPKGGDIVRHGEHKFTIVDMDGRRIAKVKIERQPALLEQVSG